MGFTKPTMTLAGLASIMDDNGLLMTAHERELMSGFNDDIPREGAVALLEMRIDSSLENQVDNARGSKDIDGHVESHLRVQRPAAQAQTDINKFFVPWQETWAQGLCIFFILVCVVLVNWGLYEWLGKPGRCDSVGPEKNCYQVGKFPWGPLGVHALVGWFLTIGVSYVAYALMYHGYRRWSGNPIDPDGENLLLFKLRPLV
jgi:hypothetical protein